MRNGGWQDVRISGGSTAGVEAPHCADGVSSALMAPRNFTLNSEYLIVKEEHNDAHSA